MNKKNGHVLKIYFFLAVIGVFNYSIQNLIADMMTCVPSYLAMYADTPQNLSCGTSDKAIVGIGNIKTQRYSYQPYVEDFTGIHGSVATKYVAEADAVVREGLSVKSDFVVRGKVYSEEQYDSYGDLIYQEIRFEPYSAGVGQAGNQGSQAGNDPYNGGEKNHLKPNSIGGTNLYYNTNSNQQNGCTNSYVTGCLGDTYAESGEFNPDSKTLYIGDQPEIYSQSKYTPPEPLQSSNDKKGDDKGDKPSEKQGRNEEGALTQIHGTFGGPKLSPELSSWKLEKILQSFDHFQESKNYAKAKNEQFEAQQVAQDQAYQHYISDLSAHNAKLKQASQKALTQLHQQLSQHKIAPPTFKVKNWYSLNNEFSYYQFEGQAKDVLESQLTQALQNGNTRKYIEISDILYNSKDFNLNESPIHMNESGIIQSDLYGNRFEQSPFDNVNLKGVRSVHNRELLRESANKFQEYWIDSQGLELVSPESQFMYATGAIYFGQALKSAEENDIASFLAYAQIALGMLEASANFSVGMGIGAGQSLYENIMSYPQLAALVFENYDKVPLTKEEWVEISNALIVAAPKIKEALYKSAAKYADDFKYGDAKKKGEIVGYVVTEVLTSFIPQNQLAKLGKVGKVVGTFNQMTSMGELSKYATPKVVEGMKALSGKRAQYMSEIVEDIAKSQNSFIKSQSDEILTSFIKEQDEDMLYGAKKLLASTRSYEPTPQFGNLVKANPIFTNQKELDQTLLALKDIKKGLEGIKGVEIEGHFARFGPKEHMGNKLLPDGQSLTITPFTPHYGNVVVHGRYGVGGADGLDVMSTGFSLKSADEALDIAKNELKLSHPNQIDNYVYEVKYGKYDNILDLTDSNNLKKLNLSSKAITETSENGYAVTQLVGIMAKRKGFSGVLAPSAQSQKPNGLSTHIFGKQNE